MSLRAHGSEADYHIQQLIDLFREIDAARDPTPSSKYIPRIKAVETIDEPPKVSKLLKNKARWWMIVLGYCTSSCVPFVAFLFSSGKVIEILNKMDNK
ncbi:hypothetical protein SCP_0509710 [Sparassis crispa]|uniref:Transmembrane protein n=1 Tax=Sparassis crispa TaxID=139825 RepID=A0A401GNY0_9APHY|nr:hypothetical protein SCP_0509710 [Sparassis crispa]GBE83912.1 hypothetical protein SCP_0509710 [Sparassis crispa]